MKASLPYHGETNRGSNILQMQIHLWHPSPIQRTVALLEQEFRQLKFCSIRRVLRTWMPDVFVIVLDLNEFDSK